MNSRPSLVELNAFAAIARHGSFRAAADELGVAPSTLSHMMRALEERLALRLFNRTTRSVTATEAGNRLFGSLAPLLGGIDEALADIRSLHERPTGKLRINASQRAAELLMREIVPAYVARFPDVQVEIVTDGRWVDVVAEGFDCGARLGEGVPKDMIAVPFGGDERLVAVAAPAYLAAHGVPIVPEDLRRHRCIRFRRPSGKLYRWEFERHGEEIAIDVPGALTVDEASLALAAALRGLGIAFVAHDTARAALANGTLTTVLDDWTPPFAGHHIYYPSRRLLPSSLCAFVDLVRAIERERSGS